ncbi:hypothetical protein I9018_11520 [Pseudomonas sp. MPFS]|uniref:hypothetical protein n=1 Tax=Pseudomonas sp. MPFS TaxID=2795724 RepID=UPI001F135128|nr:hypothetical protein [Pseudomonas sp. MPFS]UMZ14269.1 hypothetical protein I9018_11520 [Pseudomonas sp. MPFS]
MDASHEAAGAIKNTSSDKSQNSETHHWQRYIWFGAGGGLLLFLMLLLSFVAYTVSTLVGVMQLEGGNDLDFIFSCIALIDLTLLRLLCILVGASIAFAGLAVSFFAHKNATTFSGDLKDTAALSGNFALSTYSPGILGLFIGAVIIVTAILARTEHSYSSPTTTISYLGTGAHQVAQDASSPAVQQHPGFRSKEEALQQLSPPKEQPHD